MGRLHRAGIPQGASCDISEIFDAFHDLNIFGGFQKWRYPKSWMVYNGKPQSKMDDLGGPYFVNLHVREIMYAMDG